MKTTEEENRINKIWTKFTFPNTAKSFQSCPTLCDPIDGSPPGSPVPGILQARTLEWGAIAFSIPNTKHMKIDVLIRYSVSFEPAS